MKRALYLFSMMLLTSCIGPNQNNYNGEYGHNYTYDMYNKISSGQTYSEVVRILGSEGNLEFESTDAGIPGYTDEITSRAYTWYNSDGSSIVVTFANNKVDGKMQNGL